MAWRMVKMCENCPFAVSGAGLHLRKSLRAGRWREILNTLRNDGHFTCHKTSEETGDGSDLMCAGAIEWQESRGLVGQLQRIMERIDHIYGGAAAKSVVESFRQIGNRIKASQPAKEGTKPCQSPARSRGAGN